ncbi:hyaluronan mediated motility receptor isoform X1 [Labeo rohita]|uniref:hyaluronan mediated motility receptor isoform X1 n=1 Tax=Labeo rohita TaxID=84645 RepID=UPI0021E1CE80|nr:hyaluronan mediated motility receptor isoform X1 [Labeo rohita]XP_050983472.1 hyaluronan mediated motility receptor isoform X1 [Labeo rohita]XP_050983473.1 hyaluronan mediated motility receptor isoform X1 [Labeo rohita]
MSFSRAPLKRFNEHVGCAPPPGTYDVKSGEVKGPASFHKAERFRTASKKEVPLPSPSKEVPMSPVRRTMSVDGLADALSSKKDKNSFTLEMKHQRLLEKEIRSLVQQRGEQDRRLLTLEQELKKLESKLLVAVREKTGLAANVASLERQLAELKKANEFLKTKVSADITKKKINSLSMELIEAKNKLDAKDKELSFLQISSEGKVKVLETDLETARTTFRVLQERNKDLEDLHQETRVQNEQLENEMDKLHNIIQELRVEIKALQSYLDSANEEIQDLRIKLQDKSTMERRFSDTQENLSDAEKKLEKRTSELQDCREVLKAKEEELRRSQQELQGSQRALEEKEREMAQHVQDLHASQASLKELEEQIQRATQDLEDSQSVVRQQEQELARVKEILRRTEDELDQRVALMGERCLVLEDERARTQEEGLRRVQELKAEISSLEESRKSEKEAFGKLKEEHDALTKQLEEEKTHSGSLASMLERLRDETEADRRQLGEELEDALEELSELEKQERCSEEAIQHLTQKNQTLEQELKNTCIELEKKCAEMQALEEAHVMTIKKLEEDHNSCLAKLGDVTTDFESTRRSLGEQKVQAEAQAHQLQEEMNQLKQQLQQDQQKLISYQEMQDKQREEHARMLLEVQTKLAQREEESKRAAETWSEELRLLRTEVEQERGERERAQTQLEREQKRRQSVEGRSAEASSLQGRVEELEDEVSELNRQVQEERDTARRHAVEWQQERQQLCRQMEEERQDYHKQLAEAQMQSTCDAETEHWRNLYEELYAKVKPFQEQLDRFAAERNALLSEKGATQAELNKLADAYANLMGHQNQKQKIKHMVKLKEENLELKQEVSKLRAQVGKQKQELDRLKSSQTSRRFDPSKAFKHELKENQQPTSALTPGNKKLY